MRDEGVVFPDGSLLRCVSKAKIHGITAGWRYKAEAPPPDLGYLQNNVVIRDDYGKFRHFHRNHFVIDAEPPRPGDLVRVEFFAEFERVNTFNSNLMHLHLDSGRMMTVAAESIREIVRRAEVPVVVGKPAKFRHDPDLKMDVLCIDNNIAFIRYPQGNYEMANVAALEGDY